MAKKAPCGDSLKYLSKSYEKIYAGLKKMPQGYTYNKSSANPWKAAGSGKRLHILFEVVWA